MCDGATYVALPLNVFQEQYFACTEYPAGSVAYLNNYGAIEDNHVAPTRRIVPVKIVVFVGVPEDETCGTDRSRQGTDISISPK